MKQARRSREERSQSSHRDRDDVGTTNAYITLCGFLAMMEIERVADRRKQRSDGPVQRYEQL
jgi:hypothetical protein